MDNKEKLKLKQNGRVYTPLFIVQNILDMMKYRGDCILNKNIIDNSCGDGAFLTEVVRRYCEAAIRAKRTLQEIKKELECHVFGIEIDRLECQKCIRNLEYAANQFGIFGCQWNIICADTLQIKGYEHKMDYVVGNPPYVRVHNLKNLETIKLHQFSKEGMTDLYIVFFEIGLKMLNEDGILGYITPSSYFTSKSGRIMREHFIRENILTDIVDLKHNQVFSVSTYTCMTILKNRNTGNQVSYYEYDMTQRKPVMIDTLTHKEFMINNCFYFSNKHNLRKLKSILDFTPIFNNKNIQVKNGFATLLDDFFIQDHLPFTDYVIPVLKSSTGKWKQCFFPYKEGKLISYEALQKNEHIRQYYNSYKESLKSRNLEKQEEWWGFGRTQGINDIEKTKYAINSLVKTQEDIRLIECKGNSGVYSGLYIMTDITFNELKKAIISDDFLDYVSLLGKYKSGGYYTFSSKDIKKFLDYTLLKG